MRASEAPEAGADVDPSQAPWPHAPEHRLGEAGAYIVTAAAYQKAMLFADGPRLRMLHQALLSIAAEHGLRLQAWAVFPNHYHMVAQVPADGAMRRFLRELHSRTAIALNRRDTTPGRRVWHNFWETALTNDRSYFARLAYVQQNAVRHGLVPVATQYPWCSAAWFERRATAAQVKTLARIKIDRVSVPDDF